MHLRAMHRHIIIELEGALPAPSCFCRGPPANVAKWLIRRSWVEVPGTAREGAAGMAAKTTRAGARSEHLPVVKAAVVEAAVMAGAAVLGSLTIPGRAEHVREARAFIAKALGDLHPSLEDAVLLTSELVTNAVMHSASHCAGGTVTVQISESAGGVRVEVADAGSDLSAPVVRGDVYASDGHGLFLVQTLSDQWGYLRDDDGTTVWFWLGAAEPASPVAPG
jgi:anti-sigma regulatory factor (Ser/Thr protein kinase)